MKKGLARFIIAICVCVLTIGVLPATKVTATAQELYVETFGYAQMKNEAQKAAYVEIARAMLSQSNEGIVIELSDGLTKDDVVRILRFIPYDYPEAFYFRGSCSLAEIDGTVFIVPLYTTNTSEQIAVEDRAAVIAQQKKDLDNAVRRFVANVPSYVDTDVEKSTYVFEYLAKTVEYVEGDHDQTAYGALVNKRCVCAGYAAAYTILMRELGVTTWMVTGKANNGSYSGPHAWNVSWINGKCVYTDPTWGDGGAKIRYQYLNTSGKKINKTHTWDDVYDGTLYDCDHNLNGYETPTVKVSGIILNGTNKTFTAKNQTWQIQATAVPSNAANKKLSYSSTNKSIATVSATGLVVAVGEGETEILIKSEDGGAMAAVKVTVDYPDHKHTLKRVPGVTPTCTQAGSKEYFMCDGCGAKFWDRAGKNKLTDIKEIEVPPASHEAGETKYDEQQHWITCKTCDKVSKLATHVLDKDGQCFACGYKAAIEQPDPHPDIPTEPTVSPTTPTTEPPEDPTSGEVEAPNVQPSDDATKAGDEDEKYDGRELSPLQMFYIAIAIIGVFLISILFIPAEKK